MPSKISIFDEPPINPIIKELVSARKRMRLHRYQVADLAGYDRGSMWRWENGISQPSLATLCNWAEALGYSLTLTQQKTSVTGMVRATQRDDGTKTWVNAALS